MKRLSMSFLAAGLAAGLTALAAGQAANCAKAPTVSVGITPFACQSTWGNQLTQSNATTGSTTINKIGYFRFTPDTTARYFFGICGATSDSKMALGAACPTGATVRWTVLGYNDDSCLLAPPSTLNYASRLNPTNANLPLTAILNAGQTYYLGIGGYGSTNIVTGNLSIEIEPPPFDPCAAPVNGGVGDTLVTTDSLGTGPSLNLSGFCTVGTDSTLYKVHYVKFTAPYNGDFIANSCLQASDMRMAVLTACGDPASTLACNDNHSTEGAACPTSASAVQFSATAGGVYYIAFGLGLPNSIMPSQVVINIRDASIPLPTPCDPEYVMEGVIGVQQVLKPTQWWWPNLNLTGICNPGPFGDDLIYKPKYIRFTALANGTITVSNCTDTGANVDARIAAMTECGVAATTFVCDDDACTAGTAPFTSKIEFEGVAGTTYYFAVGGYSASVPGPYNVTIVAPEAPGIPEDLNGDGLVDAADLAILLGAWGTPGPGDFNDDGVVDAGDLATMLGAWTVVPPGWATVLEQAPDPAVVTDASYRAAIVATGLPWRVRDNASQIEMLLVPPGTFDMGCSVSDQNGCFSQENPVHAVTLTNAFYLGRYEVTQAEWTAVMGSNPSYFPNPSAQVPAAQVPLRPVERVTWNMVQGFNTLTGLRLPTEAEWEYAYRAGTTTAFHSFSGYPNGTNDESLLGNIAWWGSCCGGNSASQTRPVGGKQANALGLHDMNGNVWEWVNDWWSSTYYQSSPSVNPPGPSTGTSRVLRGSSWVSGSGSCRASNRVSFTPDHVGYDLGFRAARTP